MLLDRHVAGEARLFLLRVELQLGLIELELGLLDLRLLLHLGLIGLHALGLRLCLLLHLGALELHALGVGLRALLDLLRLQLELLHRRLRVRIHRRRGRERLQGLLRLLDDGRQRGEHVARFLRHGLRRLGQHAVEGALVLGRLQLLEHVAEILAGGLAAQLEYAVGVPHREVLLDVVQHHRQVRRRDQRVHAQRRRQHVGEVRLEVRDVILLWEGHDRPAHRRRHVLVHRVLLLRLHRRVQQLLGVRDLERVEDALLDLAQVVQLRQLRGALRHGLHLREALRLAEDVRIADGHDVERPFEVVARGQLFAELSVRLFVVEVHAVEPVQDRQQLGHAVVQARVDGAEHHHALLDLGERGADRRVRVAVGDVVDRRADDALARVDEEAEQLIQNCGRRVVGQGHDQLADVVRRHAALDLHHLRRLDLEALPALAAALELQHRLAVADVCAVEQGAQGARRRGRQTADHVRQADRVRAAPRHERELDEPLQLFLRLVQLVPVAVDRQHLA